MTTFGGRGRAVLAAAAVLATGVLVSCDPAESNITRPDDPVVLTGATLPRLVGSAPGDVVAFRSTKAGWQQIPVQVDERKNVDLGLVYNSAASGVVISTYADAGTHTGADTNAALDADDEVAFMAADAGGIAPSGSAPPAGVVAGTGTDIRITDPLASGPVAHVYLFRRAVGSGLVPGAGKSYVSYSFSLTSGAYLSTYKLQDGPNPENSTITTARYRRHFADRWLGDQLTVLAPGASGVDILERNKSRFAPGYCGRSEDTFNDAEGAFIANRVGPVRAIRSYIGANSGPWTQREHVFYAGREDQTTNLRVHSIPGIMDYLDLNSAATGMTYRNNANQAGVTVDGVPDTVAAAKLVWESLDGPQGSVVQSHRMITSIASLPETSFVQDDLTPADAQCTGDAQAIGQSGPRLATTIACTDPQDGCSDTLAYKRTLVYGAPGVTAAAAALTASRAATPLTAVASAWPPA